MRISDKCATCLYDKQKHLSDHPAFLAEVQQLIDERPEGATAPYMVYLFDQIYEKYFGKKVSYKEIKKKYNDLVLGMEDSIRKKIEGAENPLETALAYARIGNYIDFGAMTSADEDEFFSLFGNVEMSDADRITMQSMLEQCEHAASFLLISDNCGEIVLDKLFLEQMKKRFPHLKLSVLVRGEEVLNDATMDDAKYVGIDQIAEVVDNGMALAGTPYGMLPVKVREVVDGADVILAKGQGNYESLSEEELHIFFAFLCKCEHFMQKFEVPKLTGMFIEKV